MRIRFHSFIALALILPACSSTRPAAGKITPAPYVRIVNSDSNLVQLQIATRKFVPTHGKRAVIWLSGVSHIGDASFYAAIQKHLDQQTIVLYEGISEPQSPNPLPRSSQNTI